MKLIKFYLTLLKRAHMIIMVMMHFPLVEWDLEVEEIRLLVEGPSAPLRVHHLLTLGHRVAVHLLETQILEIRLIFLKAFSEAGRHLDNKGKFPDILYAWNLWK